MSEIKLTIAGRELAARPGQTILQVAQENGIDIPNLCNDPRLVPTGACRLCVVEIKGQPGLQISCTRAAEAGMVVETETEAILRSRKNTLELLLSEHRVACTTCDADGDCLLQDYSYRYQAKEDRFANVATPEGRDNYTTGNKALEYDPSKCIRCQRCIRICAEVVMDEALTMRQRAMKSVVSTGFDLPLKETTCETCGQCIDTCPTGALLCRAGKGQGRAKDLEKVRTTCAYCGVGCQVDLNVNAKTGRIARVTSEAGCIPNDGNLCVKGRFGWDFVHSPDRLTKPLIREGDKFREASWDEAIKLVASRFAEIKAKNGPGALAGLSSARVTNEENYLFQKLVRTAFGTNNVDHCARLCHASTVAGLARAFGSGAMTNSIAEIKGAEVIFIIGSNPTECHPVIGYTIRQAAARGTKLIVADPRKIELTRRNAMHLQHACGSDVALINGMMRAILDEDLWNRKFVEERCENFEEFEKAVRAATVEDAARIAGVPADAIREAARLYAKAGKASIVYAMGITQHSTGTDNVLALGNLAMLTGNLGRESVGVNPLRGQNNVQGACDMGALPNVLPGYQSVEDPALRQKFQEAWKAELPPKSGLTVVEIVRAAGAGAIKGLYIMGENPMLSDPDICHVEPALKSLEFLCVQDMFLTETAKLAHVVLPAASFAEKDGTFTNTERRVQRVRKAVKAPGEAKADWEILCLLSTALGRPASYSGPAKVFDEMAALAPAFAGMNYRRLDDVGLQWPCPTTRHPGTKFLHKDKFTRGKGRFHAVAFKPPQELPDEQYPVVLTTGRILEQYHTGTMSRRSVVLEWLAPNGEIEMAPALAQRYGVKNGDTVRVTSRRGSIEVKARVVDKPREDTAFLAFHYRECPANALTNAALDPVAKIPEFKVCAVRIERVG